MKAVQSRHGGMQNLHDGKLFVTLWLILIGLFLGHAGAFGQTNERVYEELDFRFVTPGARAIAMGKTFVGLADDATAAYSNPAGLSNLLEQEVSFEFTSTDIKHHRFVPSETAETQVFGERVLTPSFFSYALPKRSFTFSFFRNVVQHYQEEFQFRGRYIPSIDRFENGAFGEISIQGENYSIGLSYLVNPYLSIGGSLMLSAINVATLGRTGPPERPRSGTDTVDARTAPAAIIGVLIKPTRKLSIGAVYNTGSTFELETTLVGEFVPQKGDLVDLTGTVRPIDYVIPNRVAAGISYKITDNLTAAFDAVWINYSKQITKNFQILNFYNQLTRENYYVKDAYEFHAGAEYRIYRKTKTFAIRAGAFSDPDHQLHFRRFAETDPFAASVEEFRFNRVKQKTDVGYTFGGGIALANKIQFDAAFSFSRDADEIVVSWVVKL